MVGMDNSKEGGSPDPSRQARLLRISAVLTRLSDWALYLAGFGLVAMTVLVAYQVFSRFILNSSPSWTEVSAIMVMSWFIFLGAAVGVRENFHMGFDVLLYILPKGSKAVLRTISDLIVFTFALGMVWYGGKLVALTWRSTVPSLGVPGGFDYLPLVAGGLLISLFSLERMVLRWAGISVDKDINLEDVPDMPVVQEA
jgi:TRAP-type C4-dicarboxylate transport system permease small subunit